MNGAIHAISSVSLNIFHSKSIVTGFIFTQKVLSRRFISSLEVLTSSLYYLHIYQPLRTDRLRKKVNFKQFHWFESRVFILRDRLPYNLSAQPAPLFTHCWRENSLIHTFSKFINSIWKFQQFGPEFELRSSCPFYTTITIAPRTHRLLYMYLKMWLWCNNYSRGKISSNLGWGCLHFT